MMSITDEQIRIAAAAIGRTRDKEDADEGLASLIVPCVAIGFAAFVVVAGTIIEGWVLTYLWRWFVVPLFGFPLLGIAQAAGLALVARVFIPRRVNQDNKEKATWAKLASLCVQAGFGALISLGAGWIIHRFI